MAPRQLLFWTYLLIGIAMVAVARPQDNDTVGKDATSISRGEGVLGTCLQKENLAAVLLVLTLVPLGLVAMVAPELIGSIYQTTAPKEGSFAYLMGEYTGSTALGTSIMMYLAVFTNTPVPKVIAYSSFPCMFITYKAVLKGTFKKTGCKEGTGLGMLASFLIVYPLFVDMGDTSLWAKFFLAFPGCTGIAQAFFDSGLSTSLYGLNLDNGIDESYYKWSGQMNFAFALLGYCFLFGMDVMKALAVFSGMVVIMLADYAYISKDKKVVSPDQSALVAPAFMLLYGLLGLGLLLDEKVKPATTD